MRTFKDTDIREALQRKFVDTPKMPSDLSERLLQRIDEAKETTSTHHKLPIALRWIAAAAVLVAVLALFTWKSHSTKTMPQMAKHENAPKVIEKDNVDKSPTTHVMIANDTREVEQRHTRRLKTSQPKKKNEEETKEQNTLVEPVMAQVKVLPMQEQNPSIKAVREAQEIRQRGEQVEQYVAMLNERMQPEQLYVEY